ncbi:transglutaminase domain-containing protein [Planococcus sp. N028]|uniref:Transglutaminase domain-containing protein n=1 Tax=Planococcus shixiaomingii TaxID=3058393 RepID=A0ABT8N3Z8_9BACL|nr:transglutaminase domain-containing protein [Planococcus sp. N028]MDN7242601.1 transglutaminase domain-containing protein [Planococcus sp. N028]
MNNIRKNKVFMAVLYVLVFLLLAEWLTPVMSLTDTAHKSLFLIFIGLGLVMALTRVPWWFSGPIKIFYILWFIVYVYTGQAFFSNSSIVFLWSDFTVNFIALTSQNWAETTDVFRTVLFFALLWMAVYLIHYWVSFRLSIFLFYLLTVVFIAVLDTFSPYTGDTAIIRIMVIGLMLAGLLHLARWIETHRIPVRTEKIAAYVIPLFLMVAASTAVALYLPKSGPIWPDPVPYITSFSGEAGTGPGGTIGRIGYGVDDSQLGGSFIGDDTPVFRAEVENGQYWKVESKDFYTTKGWRITRNVGDTFVYANDEQVDTDFTPGDPEDEATALLAMEQDFPFVLYPYGTKSFVMNEAPNYQYDTADQRFETFLEGTVFEPNLYEVKFSEPTFSLTALQETSVEDLEELPAEFDRFVQLPNELPQRVKDLAVEITEGSDSVYDKTRAIERYFSNNDFEYSQQDIPIPEEGQDYVDQFLFETKRGYCDNFSTSMVVLLRSLDIPARWVKGFNEGELIKAEDGPDIYEITNNNAHSWVEAYMPGVGWMLFEPTIGFTGAADVDFDLETGVNTPEDVEMPDRPDPLEPEQPEVDAAGTESTGPSISDRINAFFTENKAKIVWSLIGIALLSAFLFKMRSKWMPKVLIPYYRTRSGGAQTFEKAYLRLLKQLDLYGIKRREGQTLQSYAAYIDTFFGTHEMSNLTVAYERSVYGGNSDSINWHELKESWENLINRTSG